MSHPYLPPEPPGQPAGQHWPGPPPAQSWPGQPPAQDWPGQPPAQGWPGQPADAYPSPVAPPPRKKRTGLKITLGVFAVLLVLCGGGGYLAARPILKEYPATVSAPSQMAGLSKSADPALQKQADELAASLKTESGVTETAAAFYTRNNDMNNMIMAAAAAVLVITPETELDNAFKGLSTGSEQLTNVQDVPTGDLGGKAKCGVARVAAGTASTSITFCAWADHGSVGIVGFFNRPMPESIRLFADIRAAMVKRT